MKLNSEEKKRYSRHLLLGLIQEKGQLDLKQGKVLVVGAGGLGSPALLYLAAAGVGTIGIADGDTVDITNLQRQVIYDNSSVGKSKAEEASRKVRELNPHVFTNIHKEHITTLNAIDIFSEYDVIIDGSDNFSTRYIVNDACVLLGKPVVYGAVFKFHGQVSVFNYEKNGERGPTYRCLFPEPPAPGASPACGEIGVLGVLPGLIGTMQATETIKILTGIGEVLSGQLLLVDALTQDFQKIRVERNDHWKSSFPPDFKSFREKDYKAFCEPLDHSVRSVTAEELYEKLKSKTVRVLDVRERNELPFVPELTDLVIPLSELHSRLDEIPEHEEIVVFLQKREKKSRCNKTYPGKKKFHKIIKPGRRDHFMAEKIFRQ